MKFDCGMSPAERRELKKAREQERYERLTNWHDWYAWFPARVGSRDCRWLEVVERRLHYYLFDTEAEYREKGTAHE